MKLSVKLKGKLKKEERVVMAYPLPVGTRSHMTTAMMKDYQLRRGREGPSTAAKGMICLALVQSLTSLIVIAFGIYRLLLSCNNGNLGTGAWVGGVVSNERHSTPPPPLHHLGDLPQRGTQLSSPKYLTDKRLSL